MVKGSSGEIHPANKPLQRVENNLCVPCINIHVASLCAKRFFQGLTGGAGSVPDVL